MKKKLKNYLIDIRPWGFEEILTKNEKTTVKILNIRPKKRNSLQTHKNRSEFWQILENNAKLTIGKKVIKAKPGDTFFIKKKELHRIQALDKQVKILEISFGKFNEKDIERKEDDFGRV